MARDWKTIKDKLQANGQGPSPADWEAMQAKIAAQPALNPATKRPLWITGFLAGLIGLVLGISAWYFIPQAALDQERALPAQSIEPISEESASSSILPEPETTNTSTLPESEPQLKEGLVTEGSSPAVEPIVVRESKGEALKASTEIVPQKSMNPIAEASANSSLTKGNQSPGLSTASDEVREEYDHAPSDELAEAPEENQVLEQSVPEPLNLNEENDQKTNGLSEAKRDSQPVQEPLATKNQDPELENFPKERAESPQSVLPAKANPELDAAPKALPAAPAEEEEFVDLSTGFRLSQANILGSYLSDFANPGAQATGLHFELEWQRQSQFLVTGLSYHQLNLNFLKETQGERMVLDSVYEESISQKEVLEIRRVWVIDSMFAGRYVNDTIRKLVNDTSIVLRIDTNLYRTNIVKERVRRVSYAELPIVYGYRWQMQRFTVAVAAGVALQQAVAYSSEEGETFSTFGMSALGQGQISWRWNQHWALIGRSQFRYPLQESVFFENKRLRYSFQLGVSYRW